MVCLRDSKRLVAYALFLVVVSNAADQPVKDPRAAVSTTFNSIESRVASLEEQLNRIQKTCCSTSEKLPCTIDLAAYGFDDSPIYGYVKTSGGSSDELYVREQIDRYRGVTLFELDLKTCTTRNRRRFDTWLLAADRVKLVNALQWYSHGTILVGVTADSAEYNNMELQKVAGPFFSSYNMNLSGLQLRDKFAFVMQKGYPTKTVFQRKPNRGESLKMKIALRGSTAQDVSFHLV